MKIQRFVAAIATIVVSFTTVSFAHAEANSCDAKSLRPVAQPFPPYPKDSFQLKQQGTTLLQLVIGKNGIPIKAAILNSSGFPSLDAASAQFIGPNWRWKPLPAGCDSVTTQIKIVWLLKDALSEIPDHR